MAAEEKRSNRGGYRPGAGRKPLPGDLRRRDARIESELIDLAIIAGQGEFSSGVRYLLRMAQRVHRHDASVELPPVGDTVLVSFGSNEDWVVAQLDEEGSFYCTLNGKRTVIDNVICWCHLPPKASESPIIRLPELTR